MNKYIITITALAIGFSLQTPAYADASNKNTQKVASGGIIAKFKKEKEEKPKIKNLKQLVQRLIAEGNLEKALTQVLQGFSKRCGKQLQLSGAISRLDIREVKVSSNSSKSEILNVVNDLKTSGDVLWAEPDWIAEKMLTPNDTSYALQAYLPMIRAGEAWDITTGSNGVTIAVIDTGVQATNSELTGRVLPGYDFVNGDNDASDDNGHGTAVAGVIAAAGNNASKTAGVTWNSRILPVKVLGSFGEGAYSAVASGITYAADNGAKIINLSLGGANPSNAIKEAIEYAGSKGVIIIASAGNSGDTTPMYPAAYSSTHSNVISVGGLNGNINIANEKRWPGSSHGPTLDLSAPSVNIPTINTTGGITSQSGTSFSAPMVSGAAALMVSRNADLTPSAIKSALRNSATDITAAIGTGPGDDDQTGMGRLDVRKAIDSVVAGANPTPSPTPTTAPLPSPTPTPTKDTSIDSVAPTVVIGRPLNGTSVRDRDRNVGIWIGARDDRALASLQIFLGSPENPLKFLIYSGRRPTVAGVLSVRALSYDTANTITAIAKDKSDNTSSSTVTVQRLRNNQ